MSEAITLELFNHLVELAALALEPGEAEYVRKQLNNQLKAIQELEAIPLAGDVKATSHGVPFNAEISPALREDEWRPYPNAQGILAQAPETSEAYIVVPDIPHTTLE